MTETYHRPCERCGGGVTFTDTTREDDAEVCPDCGAELSPIFNVTVSNPGVALIDAGHEKQITQLLDEPLFPEPNWKKPSRAVCASDGDDGWVIFYCGPHVEMEIDNRASRQLDGLIDGAPAGISIWEGTTKGGERTYEGDFNDTYLEGTFRPPTDEEWTAIREGRCPWDPGEWLLDVAPSSSGDPT